MIELPVRDWLLKGIDFLRNLVAKCTIFEGLRNWLGGLVGTNVLMWGITLVHIILALVGLILAYFIFRNKKRKWIWTIIFGIILSMILIFL